MIPVKLLRTVSIGGGKYDPPSNPDASDPRPRGQTFDSDSLTPHSFQGLGA